MSDMTPLSNADKDKPLTKEEWERVLAKLKMLYENDKRKNPPDYGQMTVDALNNRPPDEK